MKAFEATIKVLVPVHETEVGASGYLRKKVKKSIVKEVARMLRKEADNLELLVDLSDIGSIIQVENDN